MVQNPSSSISVPNFKTTEGINLKVAGGGGGSGEGEWGGHAKVNVTDCPYQQGQANR